MATYHCRCGCNFKIEGHGQYEYRLLNNKKLEELCDDLDTDSIDGDNLHSFMMEEAQEAYRCPECKRLYLYDTIGAEMVLYVYKVEDVLRDEPGKGIAGA